MEIRIRATGQLMTEHEFRVAHANTSFPPQLSAALLDEFGADVVMEGPQAQPTRYQTAYRDGVQQINGKWYTKYSVADMDADAIAAKDAEQAKAVRADRNKRLADSDWTQLSDAPVGQTAWAVYRQALRDIPDQVGFPWEITWPVSP
jgi:hypothetical protein